MSISYKLRSKKLGNEVNKSTIPFWAQPRSKLEIHSAEKQKIKEKLMKESLGLGQNCYGTKTDTETQSWFRLPIPKPGFGHTLIHRYRISFGNKFDKNKQDKKNKTDK